MNNRWNQFIYRLWAPVYDTVFKKLFFQGRKRALEMIQLKPGENVCLVGIGTGMDLPLLPSNVYATGVDLSESMLVQARSKLTQTSAHVELKTGDAQALPLEDGSFDAAVLNLILSVVPDPVRCISEVMRILKKSGRIVIFDKFVRDDVRPSLARRVANFFTMRLGTDINRRLSDILQGIDCEVVQNEPGILGGMYRVILLRKTR